MRREHRGRIQRKTWCMGPCAGVDYNLTLCLLQSRLQHIYHGQPYARVDLNPMSESTLSPNKGLWIWPLSTEPEFASYIIIYVNICYWKIENTTDDLYCLSLWDSLWFPSI
jgi:hypothetical protein